ncbi:glutaredoxin family protein [Oxalobacteraceae bacterium CAVE-383]|nr:glutaredoxin family protein [Oxalobacteraceae bacterium CAVE-383]
MPRYRFTIYSRSYCHLCDDMRDALAAAMDEARGLAPADVGEYAIKMVDIDAEPALLAQYDELVPVLLAGKNDGQMVQLCHYFLDRERLSAFLAV